MDTAHIAPSLKLGLRENLPQFLPRAPAIVNIHLLMA